MIGPISSVVASSSSVAFMVPMERNSRASASAATGPT